MSDEIIVEEVVSDLKRVQEFDPSQLVQRDRLGAELSFEEVVEPAKRIISTFRKLPPAALLEFPFKQKQDVQSWSKSAFALFQEVLDFNVNEAEVQQRRDALIAKVAKSYQGYFNNLFPLISYAVARTVDFDKVASEGRAAVQAVRDETGSLLEQLQETSIEAQGVLQRVQEAAAEQGVTQQAKYFGEEASNHQAAAAGWLYGSLGSAATVLLYACSTVAFRSSPIYSANTTLEAVQVAIGKVLIFLVLVFLLFQCVRNYSAHRHNYVANKHRQNALLTYTTLAEATGSPEAKDIVLQHAALAIYQPGDSGYIRREDRGGSGLPVLSLSPHSVMGQANSSSG